MPRRSKSAPDAPPKLGVESPSGYLSRELSTLAFNERVLEEASDPRQPLLERLKFAAVFASNLDEFFTLRISGLREHARAGVATRALDGMAPAEELAAIRQALLPALAAHQRAFAHEIVPRLAEQGIVIADYAALTAAQKRAVRRYFDEQVFPICTPLAIDPGHPFPLIATLTLNLAVVLDDPDHGRHLAIVRVPDVLPRFVPVPGRDGTASPSTYVWLEDVVAAHVDALFPGVPVAEAHLFRVIRCADIEVTTPEAGDLLEIIEAGVSHRRFAEPVALMVTPAVGEPVRALLEEHLDLAPDDVWVIDGRLALGDLMELYGVPGRDDLRDAPFTPHVPTVLTAAPDVFAAIRQQDVFLQHPYDSYQPVVDFIHSAAVDPHVLALKQTLYRVGKHSAIVDALREAADRGKEVAVLMELTAQGDEGSNVEWARTLERSGVHVTYGVLGLKTHGKVTLVVRQEGDGLRRYVHIGSGNYNPETARRRTDVSLLTCHPEFGADASDLFNHITGYSKQTTYRKLLVAPTSLRPGLVARIEREIAHQQRHADGRLIFKMNALVDPEIVDLLYRASQAGVEIDVIVRGLCCLRPGVPGLSEHIRVMSVIGRFLEHSRLYYFHNDGAPEVLFGSADLMPRNLDKRIEVLAPIESESVKRALHDEVLRAYLHGNVQAWDLTAEGTWVRRRPVDGAPPLEAQVALLTHHWDAQMAAGTDQVGAAAVGSAVG
jgi:polyphosphate kinase